MPIDARIPQTAFATPQQPIDLLGMARQATALHAERAEAETHARKAAAQRAFQQAVSETEGDYDRALDLLDQRGFGDSALALRGDLQKYRTEAFKTIEQQTKARTDELKLFSSLANIISDDESQTLVLNSLTPELKAMASRVLGETYDPARAQQARDTLLTEADRVKRREVAFNELKDARNWQAGTAERLQKETTALAQYLSTAETPEEYAQTLERAPMLGISGDVVKLFAGKTAQQAAAMGISPEKRADDARMAQQLAEQQRHNQVSEGISRGQLGVAQGNLKVRQQEASAGATVEGAKPAAGDAELIEAILANPAIYADLTPTIKARLAGTLAKRGFTRFSAPAAGAKAGPDVGAILTEIETLSRRINTNDGSPLSNVAGMARRGMAAGNMDNDVAQYQSLISGMIPMVARAVGHTGVLTQQDVDSVRAMFPMVGDNKALAQKKIATIKKLIGSVGATTAPPPSDPRTAQADPLGIR